VGSELNIVASEYLVEIPEGTQLPDDADVTDVDYIYPVLLEADETWEAEVSAEGPAGTETVTESYTLIDEPLGVKNVGFTQTAGPAGISRTGPASVADLTVTAKHPEQPETAKQTLDIETTFAPEPKKRTSGSTSGRISAPAVEAPEETPIPAREPVQERIQTAEEPAREKTVTPAPAKAVTKPKIDIQLIALILVGAFLAFVAYRKLAPQKTQTKTRQRTARAKVRSKRR
jgi:hypothetical protein